jgi:hypothetical protein
VNAWYDGTVDSFHSEKKTMLLAYWIAAVITGLIGLVQGMKYTQTPTRTSLLFGLVFLLASGGLVYLALTTKA